MKLDCSRCGIEKPPEAFHVCRANKSGRYSSCKECRRETEQPLRRVPTQPLIEAFHRSRLSKCELAKRMGHTRRAKSPNGIRQADTSPVYRILSQRTMNYETALRMARALNLDPVDANL